MARLTLMYKFFAIFGLSMVLISCASTSWQGLPIAERQATEHGSLSYGIVTSKVKKGETTQEEIIRLFGPPNITTINNDGEEVWVYDRISNETKQQGWSEASRFNVFFDLGISQKYGEGRSSITRTITVIIEFDKQKKVKDFSARATQF